MMYAMLGGTGSYYLELILFIVVCALIVFGLVIAEVRRRSAYARFLKRKRITKVCAK